MNFKWRDLISRLFIFTYAHLLLLASDNSLKASSEEASDSDSESVVDISEEEEASDSICESLDSISKEEIEELKNSIKSKITAAGLDYVTYIKQFWVGLLEGDGTITVSSPGPKQVKVRFIISIKNLRANVVMLLLIQEVIGGIVKIEHKAQYITWIAASKPLVKTLLEILKEYPLLTTRKQCQLKFATKCIENGTRDFVVENREFMYVDQDKMLKYNDKNFVLPSYFPAWLSGFLEAEGCFRFCYDKRRAMQISTRFNIGQNFEHYIISAIRDYFGGTTIIQVIVSKKIFSEKRKLLGEVKHYYLEMGNKEVKNSIISHLDKYPLMGHKLVTYTRWYSHIKGK